MHDSSTTEVLKKLGVQRKTGLSDFEADSRRAKFGYNDIPEAKPPSRALIFLRQINSPLIYIMLVAAGISYMLQAYLDMWVILAASIIDISLGFWQEMKANKALASLRKIVAWNSKVRRDSRIVEIDAKQLVPGDIILLAAGDRVPADARLLEAHELQANEAALTGESLPQEKSARSVLADDTPIGDQTNMVFSGTVISSGSAEAIVVRVGISTEFGKIAQSLQETRDTQTPLQKKIKDFTRWLGLIAITIVGVIILMGYIAGHSLQEMFTTAVAVAVSAVPEGLLSAVIVVLAVGLWRMAQRKALIRRLASAETLGSTTVICTDKTGTLTEGKMTVTEIFTDTCVHGGKCHFAEGGTDQGGERERILEIALLNNDAYIENPKDTFAEWKVIGDPTEQALLVAAAQSGLDKDVLEKEKPRVAELPFSSERKYMATLHRDKKRKKQIIYIKGAAEKVFSMCGDVHTHRGGHKLSTKEKKQVVDRYNEMSKRGLRVLAFGFKEVSIDDDIDLKRESLGFSFAGLLGMKDPLRPAVKQAIEKTRQAGIKVMMMTGDNKFTAQAIAREVGLPAEDKDVVEGKEIQLVDGTIAKRQMRDISVFARVSPEDKVHIVESLQQSGAIVAMTGDGVNDAPSLKKADIGIALGSGTDLSKEVADMILLDNDYQSIEQAVEEGRGIMENIRKVILYLLSDTFTEVIIISFSLVVGLPIPLLATQILWVNLVDDGLPDMTLALEPKEEGLMDEPPHKPDEPLVTAPMRWLIGVISIMSAVMLLIVFWLYLKTGHPLEEARTIAFTLLGVDSLLYVFSVRSFRHTIFSSHFWRNKWLLFSCALGLTLQMVAIYLPFFQNVFQTVPLGLADWGIILLAVVIIISVVEIVKVRFISVHHKKLMKLHAETNGVTRV